MRRLLMVFLGFGVIAGFSSGFASMHRWRHGGCHDWRGGRWSDARGDWQRDWREARDADLKASAPAPQTVVVQPSTPAPAAAPAPQVFVIMPQSAAPAPQVVTVPVAAMPQTLTAPQVVQVPLPQAVPAASGNVAPSANAP